MRTLIGSGLRSGDISLLRFRAALALYDGFYYK